MNQRLNIGTAALPTIPPLPWSGNAVEGRVANQRCWGVGGIVVSSRRVESMQ